MHYMNSETALILAPDISSLIHSVRDQRVIFDEDLAGLYGVATKRLNEQFRRNSNRFPPDFAFRLTRGEWVMLKSQAIPSQSIVNLKSQIATSSSSHGGRRKLPMVFTEHGSLMAATILNSPRAIAMSVYVIRAFVKMRQDLVANAAILKRLAEIDKTLLIHDVALREIWEKLRPLLVPPPPPSKPEIGFHVKEEPSPYCISRKVRRP